jgi:hypothetical protein
MLLHHCSMCPLRGTSFEQTAPPERRLSFLDRGLPSNLAVKKAVSSRFRVCDRDFQDLDWKHGHAQAPRASARDRVVNPGHENNDFQPLTNPTWLLGIN